MITYIIGELGANSQNSQIQHPFSNAQVAIVVLGWFATTWMAYRWGLRSQRLKDERDSIAFEFSARIDFVAYLKEWRKECNRKIYERCGWRRNEAAFRDELPSFIGRCERIRVLMDTIEIESFDAIVKHISERDRMGNQDSYDELMEKFERLIEIVNPKT